MALRRDGGRACVTGTQDRLSGLAGDFLILLSVRSCDPGTAVQHQLPRVQCSSEHKHEVSAYPLRGRRPVPSAGAGVGVRVTLCAEPGPFPLRP